MKNERTILPPFRSRFPLGLVTLALAAALTACGDDESPVSVDASSDTTVESDVFDAGADVLDSTGNLDGVSDVPVEVVTRLDCPGITEFPFELTVAEGAWASAANGALVEASNRDKSEYGDVYVNPGMDQQLSGILAVGTSGLEQTTLAGEVVSFWTWEGEQWVSLGESTTAGDGEWSIDLGARFGQGSHEVYAVFEAGRSCYTHRLAVWPEGTQFVLTDIDGTLTLSDDELFAEIEDPDYDQQMKGNAVELMQAWADKGYGLVYLSARPRDFRPMTDAWRLRHRYPAGMVMLSDGLVFGSTAQEYKATFISTLLDDLGWSITAAYGNATSDIDGYNDAGVPKEITFIIGENAGVDGTNAIADDDYGDHIETFVAESPESTN
jgi:hypothetical protein